MKDDKNCPILPNVLSHRVCSLCVLSRGVTALSWKPENGHWKPLGNEFLFNIHESERKYLTS